MSIKMTLIDTSGGSGVSFDLVAEAANLPPITKPVDINEMALIPNLDDMQKALAVLARGMFAKMSGLDAEKVQSLESGDYVETVGLKYHNGETNEDVGG